MIVDALNTFADATALNTGAAGSYIVGDVIDLGVARNVGMLGGGDELFLVITVDTTATSGGSATGAFNLVTDDNSSMSSPTVIRQGSAIAVATLVQGYQIAAFAMPNSDSYERYIAIQQTTAVAAFTAGKINAFLTNTPPARRSYPDGI